MELNDKREQAWKYFELHSRQRMQIFNYYIIIATAIIAGIGTFLGLKTIVTLIIIGLEVILIALTIVFWMLDRRTRFLIKHSEEYLIALEISDKERVIDIFSTESKKKTRILSYKDAFAIMYVIFILLGIILILYTIFCL